VILDVGMKRTIRKSANNVEDSQEARPPCKGISEPSLQDSKEKSISAPKGEHCVPGTGERGSSEALLVSFLVSPNT
jgi:hypothetical protein